MANKKIIEGLSLLAERRLKEIKKSKIEGNNNIHEIIKDYFAVIELAKKTEFYPKRLLNNYEKEYFKIINL